MKGIDLAKKYYLLHGRDVLKNQFADVLNVAAVGLCGEGSECFGFDDDLSHDHDFEPGFCIFLPGEDVVDSRRAFELERAYAKLPKFFEGYERLAVSPVGGNRHGVIRLGEFLEKKLGVPDGQLTLGDWLTLPEQNLLEVINGDLWSDVSGRFTQIREDLAVMPEDVRLKKLAGCLVLMGQSGNYNYTRCIEHGEFASARFALDEFVKHALHAVFLLNNSYMPYYKWCFRQAKGLFLLREDVVLLEKMMTEPYTHDEILALMERVSMDIMGVLREHGLSEQLCSDLGNHADSVNNKIENAMLRNANILSAVTSFSL